jgi:hypothetical protein
MDELTNPKLKRPMDKLNLGGDVAALDGLLSMINNPAITGAVVPPGVNTKVNVPSGRPDPLGAETPISPASNEIQSSNTSTAHVPRFTSRLFFTGRVAVGKDFTALADGLTIYGFADPLYYLASHFFGVKVDSTIGKDGPGMRAFLQTLGQWGRNMVNEKYPYTPTRACFITMIRSLAAAGVISGFEVDWSSFGQNENIWLDACLRRVANSSDGTRIGITNVRFSNEFARLQSEGFQHIHVTCSPACWRERLVTKKLTPDSPQVKDVSEQLAMSIDADLTKKISAQPTGSKLRVVWNDTAKSPSGRLYTLNEWLARANK